eukprot:TRINITY_DN19911_c0_g1_i1.p1 TRINITY_DN19911_c0_g1~~TRINITY_DN19911_c0_g1_i1.p1  ORF type:complete len:345 (+),score=59.53 TRINITY_DN19911_c0_g1_i1:125-1159(+)
MAEQTDPHGASPLLSRSSPSDSQALKESQELPRKKSPTSPIRRSSSFQSWKELVHSTTAIEVAQHAHPKVSILQAGQRVGDALQILCANHISCAPVEDAGKLVGFVDTADLLGFVSSVSTTQVLSMSLGLIKGTKFSEIMDTTVRKAGKFSGSPIAVKELASVQEVIQNMCGEFLGCNAAAVVSSSGKITNVITLADVIRFLSNVIPSRSKVRDLNVVQAPIVVSIDAELSEALKVLYQNKTCGVAVVDKSGRLIANFGPNELDEASPSLWNEAVYKLSLKSLYKSSVLRQRELVVCSVDTTLQGIVNSIYNKNVNNVYILNEGKPVGVVDIFSIVRALKEAMT